MTALVHPSPELLAKTVDGLILSAPLVSPTLEGRKTVTRRMSKRWLKRKVGDLLFVRENWRLYYTNGLKKQAQVQYDAAPTPPERIVSPVLAAPFDWIERERKRLAGLHAHECGPLRPSILLPRWASRCVLRITEAPMVERVQDITEEDARREGVTPFPKDPEGDCWTDGKYRTAFEYAWNELHGWSPNSFNENPEVVRIAFERVKVAE